MAPGLMLVRLERQRWKKGHDETASCLRSHVFSGKRSLPVRDEQISTHVHVIVGKKAFRRPALQWRSIHQRQGVGTCPTAAVRSLTCERVSSPAKQELRPPM